MTKGLVVVNVGEIVRVVLTEELVKSSSLLFLGIFTVVFCVELQGFEDFVKFLTKDLSYWVAL